jgi:hypothetical protein
MSAQVPSVGRVVHYRKSEKAPWCAALVVYVWTDEMVNVTWFDQNGGVNAATSVPRWASEGDMGGPSWCWPARV